MKIAMYSRFSTMIIEEGIEKTAEFAKEQGFWGVELLCSILDTKVDAIPNIAAARKVRSVLDDYNLPMVCYSVGCNALMPDAVDKMCRRIDIAKELGSPYVHHTLIPGMEIIGEVADFHEKIKIVLENAEKIANYANTQGITCIYEEQGRYVNGVENFGFFLHEMKKRCKNVGVCADLGNIMYVNETPEAFLQQYIEDVKHVHIKDLLHKENDKSPGMYWRKGKGKSWLRHTMVGHGIVNYSTCMKILKEAGYNGAYALELTHPEPYEQGVQQAFEYLNTLC